MTIVIGLRGRDGVVLASDSQRTEGGFRQEVRKLFRTRHGIVWGAAGAIAVQQELFGAMEALDLRPQPTWQEARAAIADAVVRSLHATAPEQANAARLQLGALFAWYSADERRTFLLRVLGDGYAEFGGRYTAIGGPSRIALFALREAEHLEYATLPLEPIQMIAAKVVDDVIRATSSGVAHPLQVAAVTANGAAILDAVEVRGLEDSVAAFRERQREFLVDGEPRDPGGDTGLRP
jgi:20S proteasome alpha/beta subunit